MLLGNSNGTAQGNKPQILFPHFVVLCKTFVSLKVYKNTDVPWARVIGTLLYKPFKPGFSREETMSSRAGERKA